MLRVNKSSLGFDRMLQNSEMYIVKNYSAYKVMSPNLLSHLTNLSSPYRFGCFYLHLKYCCKLGKLYI